MVYRGMRNDSRVVDEVYIKRGFFVFVILYSLYLEYDSPLIPSASGLAG